MLEASADAVSSISYAADELHQCQPDGHAGRNRTTRRIDVHVDVGLVVLELQEQQLGDDGISNHVVDLRPQKNDAVFEQPGISVCIPALSGRSFR